MANTRQAPRTKPSAQSSSSSVPVLGIVLGVVAVAVLAAVIFGGGGGPSDFDPGTPSVEGSLPVMGSPAVGLPAPSVTGQNFDGEAVSIANDGVAKGIVFLAHWCSHCRNEVPELQAWLDEGGSVPGTEIYSVATAFDSTAVNYPPSDWLIGEGWTPPVVVDDDNNTVLRAYGAGAFPFWVFVSADGDVVRRVEGRLGVETIQALLAEAAAA